MRHLLDSLRDCVAVNGPQGDDPQNQEVESPLREIELCRVSHTYGFYIYTRRYVEGQGFEKMICKSPKLLPWHSRYGPVSSSNQFVKVSVSSVTATVVAALSRQVRKLPASLRRSLTWDRGLELASHKSITVATKVNVYLCDPQSPWQRGTDEKHGRAPETVLSQGNRSVCVLSIRSRQGSAAPQSTPAENSRLSNSGEQTPSQCCIDRLNRHDFAATSYQFVDKASHRQEEGNQGCRRMRPRA